MTVRAGEGTRNEVVRARHGELGVSVLGRLLWVGAVTGLVVGGSAAIALVGSDDPSCAVGSFSLGAMIGFVAGVTVEILNAGLLHAARKGRPETRLTAMGLLLMLLPASGRGCSWPWQSITSWRAGPG